MHSFRFRCVRIFARIASVGSFNRAPSDEVLGVSPVSKVEPRQTEMTAGEVCLVCFLSCDSRLVNSPMMVTRTVEGSNKKKRERKEVETNENKESG